MRERLRRGNAAAASIIPSSAKYSKSASTAALFLVMEYIDGETLWAKLRGGRMPTQVAIRIASEMADALEQAHGQGFVHRDLKPANIMLTVQGHVKVMDFGLAKRVEARVSEEDVTGLIEPPLTVQGAVVGTPEYMSPEQATGQALDARSDLFSFGIILAEMLVENIRFMASAARQCRQCSGSRI